MIQPSRKTSSISKASTTPTSRPRRRRRSWSTRRVVGYPQVKGKTIDKVEFSTCSDFHAISLQFDDKTDLTFVIETGFTAEANYSDWKTGNERQIKEWPPVASAALNPR